MTSTILTLNTTEFTPLPTEREPNARQVRLLCKEIYSVAREVSSNAGGGLHGHLGMFMPPAVYITLPGAIIWVTPPMPPIPAYAGTAAVVATVQDGYNTAKTSNAVATALEASIKKMLLTAVPKSLIEELEDDLLGFGTVTVATILTSLIASYGTITHTEIAENEKLLATPWDPSTATDVVFANARRVRLFAASAGDPISEHKVVRELFKVLQGSGVLDYACQKWDDKPDADKTLVLMKIHFRSYNIKRLAETATAADMNLGAAHAARQPPAPPQEGSQRLEHYCWTHGLGRDSRHTSTTCTHPAEGHQVTATLENMQGGNASIRRARGERAVYRRPNRE
jgi:hypothetical protein